MREEYDFTPEELRQGIRGKYAAHFAPETSKGDEREVDVRAGTEEEREAQVAPLRGTLISYIDPNAPVAEDEWDALK